MPIKDPEARRRYQSEYMKGYYKRNKEVMQARAREASPRQKRKRREDLIEILKPGCTDCGEKDPVVLQFDHVRGKKEGTVSHFIQSGSWGRVLAEIEKCEIVCANCHMRRTAKRAGNWVKSSAPE